MYLYVCVPQVRLIIVDSVAFPFRQVTVCACVRASYVRERQGRVCWIVTLGKHRPSHWSSGGGYSTHKGCGSIPIDSLTYVWSGHRTMRTQVRGHGYLAAWCRTSRRWRTSETSRWVRTRVQYPTTLPSLSFDTAWKSPSETTVLDRLMKRYTVFFFFKTYT